jgi:unsaturated rhamnogalacturonyl hydrolase
MLNRNKKQKIYMRKLIVIVGLLMMLEAPAQKSLSEQMAATVMNNWKDSFALAGNTAKWSYDMGVVLKGFEDLWMNTGNAAYYKYIQQQMDFFVTDKGDIKTYKEEDYNIDNVNNGKLLLLLYRVTQKEKYLKAANLLRDQLRHQPRTTEGGFWHKKTYPYQMWLDGLYMGEPFYAEYSWLMHDDTAFNDIANQFIWMEKHARDPKTGLLYHGWDESKEQKWADPVTGCSPNFWARAMGWYADALVDALDYFPVGHPKRKELIAILNRLVTAIEKVQDPATGLWWDVLNMPGKKGNYPEASASCQYVYAVAKGVRMGYLPAAKITIAKKGYDGIVTQFIKEENGQLNLYGTVKVSGLGGKPYRDGSFDYYMSEPVIMNDPKGIGAFMLASNEMEMVPTRAVGKGKTVLLDRYFNSEKKKDVTGAQEYWHYVWEEKSNSGFSTFGHVFEKYGAKLASLDNAPSASALKKASVYIIVDPDHIKDNPRPNYVTEKDAKEICDWVKKGGVLVLMANDSANCDMQHFNILAKKFGITFTDTSLNMVKNDDFKMGAVMSGVNEVFPVNIKMYLKEISGLNVISPAQTLVTNDGHNIIATVKYGKGAVFAVGDPWLYNEYEDGRKLPAEYQNYKAAENIAAWVLKNSRVAGQ